jgi:predicted esterase
VKGGIAASRIVVGGFSQGAAMACVAALTHDQQLAGCFLLRYTLLDTLLHTLLHTLLDTFDY